MKKLKKIVSELCSKLMGLLSTLACLFGSIYYMVPGGGWHWSIIAFIIVGALVLILLLIYILLSDKQKILEFKLEDYQSIIQDHPSDENIGERPSDDHIRRCAERTWRILYGEKNLKEEPYEFFYDIKNSACLVKEKSTGEENDMVCCMIVNTVTGEVLAVWRGEP